MTSLRDRLARASQGAAGRAVLLSANPMHDTGGGQRSAQLARTLVARDFAVLFVAHGRVTETVDLGLRFEDPRLVEVQLEEALRPAGREALRDFLAGPGGLVVTQVPVQEWLEVLADARDVGAVSVYDCVDLWASELGRGWYRPEAEAAVARDSTCATASAYELVVRVEAATRHEALLLPNAFDDTIFDPSGANRPRPSDLPEGRVALYVGALWGGWLDWALVDACARAHPDTHFVFIGDHRREGRGLPDNCHFLGLKPQVALPPYLASADLALLPWKATDVTRATSPLKVYEYVAMGLPVVAPDLEPLRGIPGVRRCADVRTFIDEVEASDRSTVDAPTWAEMSEFAAQNSWGARVDALLEHAETSRSQRDRLPAQRTRGAISVAIPSYRHERFIGEAISSALRQSLPPSEVVVVDDGSDDGTRALLATESFEKTRVVLQENHGAHWALNRAISLSRGDWIAILNSDDAFEEHRLEHAWSVARATGAALVCGGVRLIAEDGGPPPPEHDITRWYGEAMDHYRSVGSLRKALERHNITVTTSNFFLHRSLWTALGGFRPFRYVHDYDFLLRADALYPGCVVFDEHICDVRYRVHGANTISENRQRADEEREFMRSSLRGPVKRARSWAARRRAAGAVARARAHAPAPAPPATDVRVALDEPRVGFLVHSMGTGGLEEVVSLLARGIAAAGSRPSVFCTHGGGPVADRLALEGVPVVVGRGGGSMTEWLDDERIDVVSSHFAPEDAVAAVSARGLPVVETVHNTYAWFGESEWRAETRRAQRAAAVTAVSAAAAAYYARYTGCTVDAVIPNAVDPSRVTKVPRASARRWLGIEGDDAVFVYVGRLAPEKNLAGLVRAFARAEALASGLRLVLLGPRSSGDALGSLRRKHRGLFRRGVVEHRSSDTDVGMMLSAADAFVSNSFFEGWSVAASEALWVGRPLVLSDAGGARELVGEDGARGILLPNPLGSPQDVGPERLARQDPGSMQRNEDALAAAVAAVAADRASWRAREDELRAYARRTLEPASVAERYLEIFRAVAAGHPAA